MTTATVGKSVPLSPLRRVTIQHLQRSHATSVPVTLFAEADARPLLELKRSLTSPSPDAKVTVSTLAGVLLARTAADHPAINARIEDDQLVMLPHVDLGLAVAVANGNLTLPVVRAADSLDVPAFAAESARLVKRARAGKLGLADVGKPTVTLSSVGNAAPGISATVVLPADCTAILLLGAPAVVPVVRDGEVTVGEVFRLSLTVNHLVVNGMDALDFLHHFASRLENPKPWLS